jgi:hypothetical protein
MPDVPGQEKPAPEEILMTDKVRADAAASQHRKCVIGEYCHTHGFVHGAEAEELRDNIQRFADAVPTVGVRLRALLDRVDARDSAAFVSTPEGIKDAAASRAQPEPDALTGGEIDSILFALKECEMLNAAQIEVVAQKLASRAPSPQGEDTFTASTMTPMERARFAIRAGAPNRDLLSALVGEIDRLVRQLEAAAPSPQDAETRLLAKRAQQTAADLRANPDHEDVSTTCRLIEDLAAVILYSGC